MRIRTLLFCIFILQFPLFAHATIVTPSQARILQQAIRIGTQLREGRKLAAIVYQESSLGAFPDSSGHYGVGSCSWFVYHHVVRTHQWLARYFRGHNWATVLVSNPVVALWVAGYWLQHCRRIAGTWPGAFAMYRYGAPSDPGRYPFRVDARLVALRSVS